MLPLHLSGSSCVFTDQDITASETFCDSPVQNWAPRSLFLTVPCYFCSLNWTPFLIV